MTEKPTAQECEKLREEVKSLKGLMWDKIRFITYPIVLLFCIYFCEYLSKEVKLCAMSAVALVMWATGEIIDTINKK